MTGDSVLAGISGVVGASATLTTAGGGAGTRADCGGEGCAGGAGCGGDGCGCGGVGGGGAGRRRDRLPDAMSSLVREAAADGDD